MRTPLFKRWFGNWEAVAARKHLEGDPVASVVSGTIQAREDERATDAVARWLNENPQGNLRHPIVGDIVFDMPQIRKSLDHGFSGPKLNAIAAVPTVIRGGAVLSVSDDLDGKPLVNTVLASPVTLDGEPAILFVRVRREDNKGGKPRFYVHEIILSEKVKKPGSFKTGAASQGEVGRTGGTGLLLRIGREVLSVNPDTVSKVVDENGEPRVVWHGTGAEFTRFEQTSDIGYHFGTRKAAQDRNSGGDWVYHGEVTAEQDDDGHWVTMLDGEAVGGWSATREDALKAGDEMTRPPAFNEIPAWLRIRRFISLPDLNQWDLGDILANIEPSVIAEADKAEITREYDREAGAGDRRLVDILKRKGFDGVAYRNDSKDKGSTSFIVFDSNQIKSATANLGTYTASGDIRFSRRAAPEGAKEDAISITAPSGAQDSIRPEYRAKVKAQAEATDDDTIRTVLKKALKVQERIDADTSGVFAPYNADKPWFEHNAEYWGSVDPDLLCQRSQACDTAVHRIKQALKSKGYKNAYTWELIARANAAGLPTPCPQCYVFTQRASKYGPANMKRYVIGVGGYAGNLLKMRSDTVARKGRTGAYRHMSSTDFKPEMIPGLLVEFIDAAKRGIPLGSYTKTEWFARIFGPTGIAFNLSVGRNERVGMDMELAKKLRREYPGAGLVYIAFNDAEILEALRNPEIDHVIPWHSSGLSRAEMRRLLKDESVVDYTKVQHDKNANGKNKDVKEHEHKGDLNTYLRLVKERGLTMRFGRIFDQLQKSEQNLFMKLIGPEYGKFGESYPAYPVPTLDFDLDAIEPALKAHAEMMRSRPKQADFARNSQLHHNVVKNWRTDPFGRTSWQNTTLVPSNQV